MTDDLAAVPLEREFARMALTRAAGGAFINGNRVRLLKDGPENYPAWLEAVARARHHVHFESYMIHDDEVGQRFRRAGGARAGRREGAAHLRLVGLFQHRLAAVLDVLARFGRGGAHVQPAAL